MNDRCFQDATPARRREYDVEVENFLGHHRGDFDRCVVQSGRADAGKSGALVAEWIIACDGQALGLHWTSGRDENPELARCVRELIGSLRFPPPPTRAPTIRFAIPWGAQEEEEPRDGGEFIQIFGSEGR